VLKTGRLVGSRRVEQTSQDEILRMIISGVTENSAQKLPDHRWAAAE
jgi:hypothetical protein